MKGFERYRSLLDIPLSENNRLRIDILVASTWELFLSALPQGLAEIIVPLRQRLVHPKLATIILLVSQGEAPTWDLG
jgi:hypothetical protein